MLQFVCNIAIQFFQRQVIIETSYRLGIGAVIVVIVWQLDLQLPVRSVPVTTKVVSTNHVHGEVYSIQHYVTKFVSNLGFLRVLQFPSPIKLTTRIELNIVERHFYLRTMKFQLNMLIQQYKADITSSKCNLQWPSYSEKLFT